MDAAPDGALAAVGYAPCVVNTMLNEQPVTVKVETNYPWEERVSIVVETEEPVDGALLLRVPAWAEGATVDGTPVAPGTFHRVERRWEGRTTVELRLPMRVRIVERPSSAVAVERGPLVYSLPIAERWEAVTPHNRSSETSDPRVQHDYEVVPTSPWNYVLDSNAALKFEARSVGAHPFSPEGAPVALHAQGFRVPDWGIEHGAAAPPPATLATTAPPEPMRLIPYGCTTLRVTEFPLANLVPSEEHTA